MTTMRILVTGSRDWPDDSSVYEQLENYLSAGAATEFVIIHGACPTGADAHAAFFCEDIQWTAERINVQVTEERYPADWHQYGKRAGFVRNAQMVDKGADICLAFIKNESKGASMTARLAEKAGIPTKRYVPNAT